MSSSTSNTIQTLGAIATIIGTVYFIYISLIKEDPQTNFSNPNNKAVNVNEVSENKGTSEIQQNLNLGDKQEKSLPEGEHKSAEKTTFSGSSKYISNKSLNTSGSIDIAVSIQDETYQLNPDLINGVSDFYISRGYNSKYNIFNDNFFTAGRFTEFYNGQLSLIDEFDLQKYCDKIAIGKMTCSYKNNSYDSDMTTVDATLYLKIISVSDNRIEKSISIHGVNTGWSKEEARANTIKEILSQLSTKL